MASCDVSPTMTLSFAMEATLIAVLQNQLQHAQDQLEQVVRQAYGREQQARRDLETKLLASTTETRTGRQGAAMGAGHPAAGHPGARRLALAGYGYGCAGAVMDQAVLLSGCPSILAGPRTPPPAIWFFESSASGSTPISPFAE